MKACILKQLKQPLVLEERDELAPANGQAVVRLHAAALNRRDYWITQGMYPGLKLPAVLGSDGAGVVSRVASSADEGLIGNEVVINPGWNWGEDKSAQRNDFRILGMPDDGTFAQEVLVPVEHLHPRPAHLDWPEAAALPLAGLTAYRALFTQGGIRAGQKVLITGIGGGVATMALQLTVAMGAEVVVTSSAQDKLDHARRLGAAGGALYTSQNWAENLLQHHGRIQLIIDGAGGEDYGRLIELAAPGGRIVSYGATAGAPGKLELFKVFWKQLHLIGSTMGSPEDFHDMLKFVDHHRLRPVVDQILPLDNVNAALDRMRQARQFGKIVLEID